MHTMVDCVHGGRNPIAHFVTEGSDSRTRGDLLAFAASAQRGVARLESSGCVSVARIRFLSIRKSEYNCENIHAFLHINK